MNFGEVIAGVLVFLLGQFVLKLVLEPVVGVRKVLATTRTTFDYYADIWANPPPPATPAGPRQLEASQALRKAAGELRVAPVSVLGYRLIRRLFGLPSESQLNGAARGLIGLSNELFGSSASSLDFVHRSSDDVKRNLRWS